MGNDIFLIPHQEKFILYAPLKGIISLLNGKAANEIIALQNQEELQSTKPLFPEKPATSDSPCLSVSNLTFILTSGCTMQCIYCYANGGFTNKIMPWNTFTGIIDFILRVDNSPDKPDGTNISFHGGDISAAWQLFKAAVTYIENSFKRKGRSFSVSVGINGLLSKQQADFIINHTKHATVSLDGYAEIQNLNRPLANGKDSFNRVDNTLKYFDKHGYSYGIRSTITSRSVKQLPEIIEFFCRNYGFKRVMVEPMFPMGRGLQIEVPGADDFVENYRKARKIAEKYHRELSYSGARLNVMTNYFCKALDNSVVITPDGDISCCYEITESSSPVAEYFIHGQYDPESQELKFDKEKKSTLHRMISKEKTKCSDCFCKFHCAGDCPVKTLSRKINRTEDYIDRCYINRELTKDQLLKVLDEDC
jgi:uncharacterized protein